MRAIHAFIALVLILAEVATRCQSLAPIAVRGNRLVDSVSGARFMVKGVGYDYDVSNESEDQWRPAITKLLAAVPHINTVRLYVVDSAGRYDKVMNFLAQHSIYAIVPLTPSKGHCTLNRDGLPPLDSESTCYPSCLLSFGQHVVNLFAPHTNTLAFTIANEVLNSDQRWAAAPCIKAFTRDIKAFMTRCGDEESMRSVPIIYTAADNAIASLSAEANDRLKMDYLTCGSEPNARIDIFGLNLFRHCHNKCDYHSCGSDLVNLAFAASPIPIIESEFGCADFKDMKQVGRPTAATNDFSEIQSLFGPMSNRFSGGVAYTFGVRGGREFAFFVGGGRSAHSTPGLTKHCGNDDRCRVDEFEAQLARTESGALNQSQPMVDDEAQQLSSSSWSVQCPQLMDFDLTIAASRQDADGYEPVRCEPGIGATSSAMDEDEEETGTEQRRVVSHRPKPEPRSIAKSINADEHAEDRNAGAMKNTSATMTPNKAAELPHPSRVEIKEEREPTDMPSEPLQRVAVTVRSNSTTAADDSSGVVEAKHSKDDGTDDAVEEKAKAHPNEARQSFVDAWLAFATAVLALYQLRWVA